MNLSETAHRIAGLPGIRALTAALWERRFRSRATWHAFRGVYPDFQSARRTAPPDRPLGYDHEGPGRMYAARPVFPEDYAVLFWLQRLTEPGDRVFDLGGHAGSAFDAYVWILPDLRQRAWTVCDVPAAIEEGRRRNAERPTALDFTDDPDDGHAVGTWLLSGSDQYLEHPVDSILRNAHARPEHVIVNQLPVHPHETFVTLQTIGTAYCPYRIRRDGDLEAGMATLGYERIDRWSNPGKACRIPGWPRHSLVTYIGATFVHRRATSSGPEAPAVDGERPRVAPRARDRRD